MGIAAKYNNGEGGKFSHKMPEGAPFKKLADIEVGKTVTIRGLYINNKGKFGPQPVALTDTFFLNLPAHLTDTVKEMIKDVDFVDAVNSGLVGLKSYSYENNGKTCYSVNWVDIEPQQADGFFKVQ